MKDFALDLAKARVRELDQTVSRLTLDVNHYHGKSKEWKKKALQAEHDLQKIKASKIISASVSVLPKRCHFIK